MNKKLVIGFVALLFTIGGSTIVFAELTSVGPIDPNTGFPLWYRDNTGRALQLCLEQPVPDGLGGVIDPCLLDGVVPNPGQPITVPGNSPDELFWWAGGAITPIIGGAGSADLVLAIEAAFAGGDVVAGDQISFARVRIRVDTPVAGDYRVTHPYGVNIFRDVGVGIREINFTEDIGLGAPGNFRGALEGRIGPYLRWDTDFPVTFPEFPGMQFVGNPAIDHTVTGSPFGTNFFRVERGTYNPGNQTFTPIATVAETNLFSVMGKIFAGALPIPKNDFDLDGKTDQAFYRPETGVWFILPSGTGAFYGEYFGAEASDILVPGDYDGDGKTDYGFYRPSTGVWYIKPSGGVPAWYGTFFGGGVSDIPVTGDFDGDGKTDLAFYRPETGVWFILPSGTGAFYGQFFGGETTDILVPGDFDGDGKTDLAFYRPGTGIWYVLPSGSGSFYGVFFGGGASDIPVPADYNGDGKIDIAIYRPSSILSAVNWYILPSGGGIPYGYGWGGGLNEIPISGDFDGDGKDDVAFYNTATGVWGIVPSRTGVPYFRFFGGGPNDVPISLWP